MTSEGADRVGISFATNLFSPARNAWGRLWRGRKLVWICAKSESAQAGFTLIEVLVALTILSISLGVLLAVFTQGLDRARESRNEAAARVLAQSLLAQAKIRPNLSMGDSSGKTDDLLWRLRIEPYGTKDDRAAWQENAAQLRATVSWRGDGRMRSITLSTLRLLPGADSDNE